MRTARTQRDHRHVWRWSVAVATCVALLLTTAAPALANDPARARQWALDRIGADAAHAVGQGDGTVIAVVDSGVDLTHEDLVANLVAGIDIVDGDDQPQDGYGHGTHVAGIAAAARDNGRGVRGVAPRAAIMPVRVLDDDGSGTTADVVAGMEWAVDNGADVINLSLGQAAQGIFGSSLSSAIEDAWAAGVVVVVSAGNEFVFSSGFGDEPALVVSATTRDDDKPDYSNGVGNARWGMAAPGGGCAFLTCATEDGVLSTYWEQGEADLYAHLSGTSMAAPHVAGAAAILLSLGLTPSATVDRLLATADDIGAPGPDSTFGAGRLDVEAATRDIDAASGASTPSPRPEPGATATSPAPANSSSPSPDPVPTTSPGAVSTPAPTDDAAPAVVQPPASPSLSPSPSPSSSPSPSPAPAATSDATSEASPVPMAMSSEEPDGSPLVPVAVLLVLVAGTGVALEAREARRQ